MRILIILTSEVIMLKRAERAKKLFETGLNCSQSVVACFADVLGLSETAAAKLSAGFGDLFLKIC